MTHCVVVPILEKQWHFQFILLSRSDYKLSWKKFVICIQGYHGKCIPQVDKNFPK